MSKLSAYSAATHITNPDIVVDQALESVRKHLGMDVAYIAEIVNDTVFVRQMSGGEDLAGVLYNGAILPLREMVTGVENDADVPSLIPDTQQFPHLENIQMVRDAEIGAIINVPLRRNDGRIYGTFCCFARRAIRSLNSRDFDVVRMFADLSEHAINKKLNDRFDRIALERQFDGMIHNNGLSIYLQPIVSLSSRKVKAVEALSRFNAPGNRSVEWWFAEAGRANMQIALEIAAIEKALDTLQTLPMSVYLSVNASPQTVAAPAFLMALRRAPPNRVIVELTEHQEIADTADLMRTLDVLRKRKIGIAIDDVGAGYAGLSTILRLKPNVMKLDRSLVVDIHQDMAKQSLTSALVFFATQENAFLIAEGVEHIEEDKTLRRLGVRLGQGFLYAHPAPAAEQITNINSQTAKNVIAFPNALRA